jgi:nucleotide-binding universal stress UspA family protein
MILGQEGVGTDLSHVLESDKERAETAADAAAAVLGELGRTFRLDVEQGEARRVLTEMAHDASMLVLGHRGRSGIAHALLGSVTTSLVHHPECVVVVVPGH